MAIEAEESGVLSRWSRRKTLERQGVALVEPMGAATPQPAALVPAVVHPAPLADDADAGLQPADPTPEPPTAAAEPAPSLADVAVLTRESNFARFVGPGVQPEVKNAALAKLFSDPHFNVMDGLDTYIDDYGKPDPLPAGMLRMMVQSHMLGLFDDEKKAASADPIAGAITGPDADAQAAPPDTDRGSQPDVSPDPDADATAAIDVTPATLTALPSDTPAHEDLAVQLQPDDDAGRAGFIPGAGQDTGRQH